MHINAWKSVVIKLIWRSLVLLSMNIDRYYIVQLYYVVISKKKYMIDYFYLKSISKATFIMNYTWSIFLGHEVIVTLSYVVTEAILQ